MNEELQIKLSALLDGALPEAEAREVLNLVARDAEATALHTELKNMRQALAHFDRPIQLPESREFYWSKIQNEIERTEEQPRPQRRSLPLWAWLRRSLIPATVLCAAVVAFLIFSSPAQRGAEPEQRAASGDSGAMTYRDYASGTTLVWLSFPAENTN